MKPSIEWRITKEPRAECSCSRAAPNTASASERAEFAAVVEKFTPRCPMIRLASQGFKPARLVVALACPSIKGFPLPLPQIFSSLPLLVRFSTYNIPHSRFFSLFFLHPLANFSAQYLYALSAVVSEHSPFSYFKLHTSQPSKWGKPQA